MHQYLSETRSKGLPTPRESESDISLKDCVEPTPRSGSEREEIYVPMGPEAIKEATSLLRSLSLLLVWDDLKIVLFFMAFM